MKRKKEANKKCGLIPFFTEKINRSKHIFNPYIYIIKFINNISKFIYIIKYINIIKNYKIIVIIISDINIEYVNIIVI